MKREQLEHIIRAAAGITGADQFVIIGSQAILGHVARPPAECAMSMEVDVFTFRSTQDADLIEGSIGEGSPFHRTFGYYAHGVGEDTATLPDGWKDRLVEIRSEKTGGAAGLCIDVHDLAISKLVAGRDKDLEFVAAMFKHKLVVAETMRSRLAVTSLDDTRRQIALDRLMRLSPGG